MVNKGGVSAAGAREVRREGGERLQNGRGVLLGLIGPGEGEAGGFEGSGAWGGGGDTGGGGGDVLPEGEGAG